MRQIWTLRMAAALGGAVLAAVALSGQAGTALAAYRGSQGRIAFVRNGDIYSIKPNGTGLVLLAGGGRDSGPRWSPNGKRLAFLDRGNLWIMNANGSHKIQITRAAPGATDGRPTWSPDGRYLAFVQTKRNATAGDLIRYDTVTRRFRTFSVNPTTPATILPGTAVAWNVGEVNGSGPFKNFIMAEGTGALCPGAGDRCLNALELSNGNATTVLVTFEFSDVGAIRLTDPDWYPIVRHFAIEALATQESCTAHHCTVVGLDLEIDSSPVLNGARQAVFSPTGGHIAFVLTTTHGPRIDTATFNLATGINGPPVKLTVGTEPDWQPVAPFPPL